MGARRSRPTPAAVSFVAFVACALASGCAPFDGSGLDAWLRVEGAQHRAGALVADDGGPAVTALLDEQSTVRRGEVGHALSGSVGAGGTAVALWLRGDEGHWIVRTGVPDVTALDQPTFAASLDFSAATPVGARDLVVRALDAAGRAGPPSVEPLTVADTAPARGALVVTLAWVGAADLDLHVVEPSGFEVWSRSPRDETTGGALDLDSNRSCVHDGVGQENIAWATRPPPGRYLVRVDTPSLCGDPAADFAVAVRLDGAVLAEARGQSTPAATRGGHDRGAGLTALAFDLP